MKRMILLFIITFTFLSACDRAKQQSLTSSVIVEGTVVKISAQTGGKILQTRCDEGEEINASDTLAVIDSEKLGYQLEQARANLEEVEVQGKILAARAKQTRDEFNYAKIRYERIRNLNRQNSASEQMRDDAKINFDRASSQLETAQHNLHAIKSRIKALQAQIKLLQKQITDATVTSPISGTVTTKFYEAGETAPNFAPVVEIIDLSKMWTKIYVTETYLPKINIGQTVNISIDGIEQTLTGAVSWISPKAEFTPKNILTEESRTGLVYAVKIKIDNPGNLLKHGMPVTVTIQPNN